jgi:hypothetical protein
VKRWLLACLLATAAAAADGDTLVAAVEGEILHADTIEVAGFRLRDVVATPRMLGRELQFAQIQAKAYGGNLTGIVAVGLDDELVRARLDLAQVDLDRVLREWRGNPSSLVGGVSGWIEFTMPSGRPDQINGRGHLRLDGGNLLQLPMLALLLAGDPTASKNQDVLDMPFELKDGRIHIQAGTLASPSASLQFTGTIGIDGSLRLLVVPTFAFNLVDRIWGIGTLVTPVLTMASSQLARAAVRGRLSEPVIVLDPFGSGLD